MKHHNSLRAMTAWIAMLIVAMFAVPLGATAQNFTFQEDFDYPAGNLYNQGNWVRYGTNKVEPIQVLDKALTYAGYNDGAPAKCVKLGAAASGEDLMKRFTDNDDGIKTGNLYFSALINVEAAPAKGEVYSMAFVPRTKKSVIAEGINPVELGRLFFTKGENADDVKIGIERGGKNPVYSATPLKLNQTYLVVLRYEVNAGGDNVYLYVNPTDFKKVPDLTAANAVIDGVNHSGSGLGNYGLQGIELRQGTNSSNTAPVMYVASLRVSNTYAGLFGEAGEDKTPKLSVSKKSFVLGEVYAGDEYEETITVKGENLTGNVTVETSNPAVTVTPATLAADDVMGADGASLKIKVKYTEGNQNQTVTLKSEGAEDITLKLSWTGNTIPEVATIKELYEKDPELGQNYKYTGEAVITFIDRGEADKPKFYIQDATAAILVTDDWDLLTKTDYNVGDKITGTFLIPQSAFGTTTAVVCNTNLGTVVSTGNTVNPVEATLAEFKANPSDYIQKVVMVKNLKFKDVAEGAKFAEGMAQPTVTDGTNDAKVRIFKGTSLIGKDIPSAGITLTGLLTSVNATSVIIGPRGIEDITEQAPQGEPSISFSPETIERTAGVLGKTVNVATIHVSAKNMTSATFLGIGGKNADQFDLSQTKIEKGSTETDITITYTPTEVAVHKAFLEVNCPSIDNYYKMINFSAYAIDEQNPPTITVEPQTLQKFTAKVNEKSEQTIDVTSANMPDYVYVKVKDAGQFILGTTMFLRNTTNKLKITFQPKAAGTYNTSLIFSALGMEDVEIPIEGVATGDTPEEPKEGVDFVLNAENPLKQLNEKFDNIERNKPLAIDRWTNSAIEGTRAWWGFSFLDYDKETPGEKVAKVTAFDSKMESGAGTPVEMILVTPPLDFKNSATKMFTFKVRGDYLNKNQTDRLELCYIDLADGEPYILPLTECVMPKTEEESGKWFPYEVDLTGQQIADVFFLAFRFTSTRGVDNAATYYIDNVTYGLGGGNTDGIRNAAVAGKADVTVFDLAGNKVAEKAEATAAEALRGLAGGMYIVKQVTADGIHTSKMQVK